MVPAFSISLMAYSYSAHELALKAPPKAFGGQDSGIESYELESIRGVVVPEKDLGSPKPLYTQKLLDAIDREPVHFCQFCLVSLAASVLRLEMHAE